MLNFTIKFKIPSCKWPKSKKKHLQIYRLANDLGHNCVFGLSETWLTFKDNSDANNHKKELFKLSVVMARITQTKREKSAFISAKNMKARLRPGLTL